MVPAGSRGGSTSGTQPRQERYLSLAMEDPLRHHSCGCSSPWGPLSGFRSRRPTPSSAEAAYLCQRQIRKAWEPSLRLLSRMLSNSWTRTGRPGQCPSRPSQPLAWEGRWWRTSPATSQIEEKSLYQRICLGLATGPIARPSSVLWDWMVASGRETRRSWVLIWSRTRTNHETRVVQAR